MSDIINKIYEWQMQDQMESMDAPEVLQEARARKVELEQRLRERAKDDPPQTCDLEQLLECCSEIGDIQQELYFRKGYRITLQFILQGMVNPG